MVEVKKKSEHEFLVIVRVGSAGISEEGSKTEHIVSLDDKYYENLTQGKITKEELIKRSFDFLLEREPKESILPKFNLKVIKNYFPEYEEKIKSGV
jgi:hypothetical protein